MTGARHLGPERAGHDDAVCPGPGRIAGDESDQRLAGPLPGSADLCFLVDELDTTGLEVVEGPVEREGAAGPLTSVYVRDPDGNLVELATPR